MEIGNQEEQHQIFHQGNNQNLQSIQKEQILNQKCPFHKTLRQDLLHLNGSATRHRMCIQCVQKNKIPFSEILSIEQLLSADSNTVLPTFPVLTDPEIISEMENEVGSVEEIGKKVDEYFFRLKSELEMAIENARSRTKIALSKLSESYCKMIDSHKEVSKIEVLQALIIDCNNNNNFSVSPADDPLHQYILNHCQESAANTQLIQKELNNFKNIKSKFQTTSFQAAESQLLAIINRIEFFGDLESLNSQRYENPSQDLSQQGGYQQLNSSQFDFNCLPCIYYEQSSDKLKFLKDQQSGSILITYKGKGKYSQCYIDQTLQRDQRYILKIEIIHNNNSQMKGYGFLVGLVQDSFKDSNQFNNNNKMSYCECYCGEGIDTIVRGGQLHSSPTSKVKRILEFRIHLASKYLRAPSLPDYASVVKLDDSSKIKENQKYLIGIFIGNPEDQVKILEFTKVSEFDNKMD